MRTSIEAGPSNDPPSCIALDPRQRDVLGDLIAHAHRELGDGAVERRNQRVYVVSGGSGGRPIGSRSVLRPPAAECLVQGHLIGQFCFAYGN